MQKRMGDISDNGNKYGNFLQKFVTIHAVFISIKFIFEEFKIFLWKKDAFDCAGIRA